MVKAGQGESRTENPMPEDIRRGCKNEGIEWNKFEEKKKKNFPGNCSYVVSYHATYRCVRWL
jgi:hypothetical protein